MQTGSKKQKRWLTFSSNWKFADILETETRIALRNSISAKKN